MTNKKKILFSVMSIALVFALFGVGIFAVYSDTETSTGNMFTAGTLNLKVGTADPSTEKIVIGNLKPGDSGNAATWLTKNDGSIAGKLTIAVGTIANNENGVLEPETGDSGDPGELGGKLRIAFWIDADKNGNWNSGDYYLNSAGGTVVWTTGQTSLPAEAYDTVDNYASDTWANVQTVNSSTELGNFRVEYKLPGDTGNTVQSDSCSFDITFTLTQSS